MLERYCHSVPVAGVILISECYDASYYLLLVAVLIAFYYIFLVCCHNFQDLWLVFRNSGSCALHLYFINALIIYVS